MFDDKNGYIPSPLIMCTCTVLRHALLEWQQIIGGYSYAAKSMLQASRRDHSNYFNFKNDGGKYTSCCTSTGCKLLMLPGFADTYKCLKNAWNTLPESYHQRVYKNTFATVQRQIQHAENATPAVVISMEPARVDNNILLHYLTSKVVLE
jgi:hypothetical protein